MNKTEKEFAEKRVREIVQAKLIKCECSEPSLIEHLKVAAVDGSIKPVSTAKLKLLIRDTVIDSSSSWRDLNLGMTEVFQQPESYKAAKAAHEAEKKLHKDANNKTESEMMKIIDKIHLNKFEDGEDAIAAAHKLIPHTA